MRFIPGLRAVKLQKPRRIRRNGRGHLAQLGFRELGHERRAQLIRNLRCTQQSEALRHSRGIRPAKRRITLKRRLVIHGHIVKEPLRKQRAEHLRAAAVGVELCFVAERAHAGKPFRQILLQRGFPAGKHDAIEKPGPFFQESKHLRLGKKRRIAQNVPVVAIEAAVVAARGKNHRRKAAGKIHRAEFF